jgi:hypothetical protein
MLRPWGRELKNTLIINVLPPFLTATAAARRWTHAVVFPMRWQQLARLELRHDDSDCMFHIAAAGRNRDDLIVWQLVQRSTNVIIDLILWLTGNT